MMAAIQRFFRKIIFSFERMVQMMAMFFAQRVILGKTAFADVPAALKAGCAEVLIDSGIPELVPEEYGGTAK
ncbi:hypothetical protein B5F35_15680 [Anaeromassilibacillus sp. An200]|nr:hypothetical protein B5F35_15680 [Anaeromassilibacillus sp. An200]